MKLLTKYIILSIFILCIFESFIIFYNGKNDNTIKVNDFESYNQACELIRTQEPAKAERALLAFEVLNNKYQENADITKTLGLAYAFTGNAKLGSAYYQKSLELKPIFQLDSNFLLQYGEILYQNGEYEKAKVVLEKALELGVEENFKATVENMLLEINKQNK